MKRAGISRAIVYLGMAACLIVVMIASGTFAIAQNQPPGATAAPAVTTNTEGGAQPAPNPGPAAGSSGSPIRIYMPDGQIKSHTIRVYLSENLKAEQNLRLWLLRSHMFAEKPDREKYLIPGLVAPDQEWIEPVEGVKVRRTGTLLLFDLSQFPFGLRAMIRILPVVAYMEDGKQHFVVGEHEVNVGNILVGTFWTLAIVGFALLVVLISTWKGGGSPLRLLTGADGRVSLSQAQVAGWTVAVGGVVIGYGLIRLEIPAIPTSLLVLMGASLTTGGVGYFQDAQKQKSALAAGGTPVQHTLTIGDLVRGFSSGEQPVLSLAKAQMLFWTLLLLVLFITKSILDGQIWEVPWPLVALMGFSQAGYLAPKLTSKA